MAPRRRTTQNVERAASEGVDVGSSCVALSFQDLDAAKAFYTGVFGWTFRDLGEEFGHYSIISNSDGAPVGGAMSVPG